MGTRSSRDTTKGGTLPDVWLSTCRAGCWREPASPTLEANTGPALHECIRVGRPEGLPSLVNAICSHGRGYLLYVSLKTLFHVLIVFYFFFVSCLAPALKA